MNICIGRPTPFLSLPGIVDASASLGFDPKRGTVDAHSLKTKLSMGDARVELDGLLSILESLKKFKQQSSNSEIPAPNSPASPSSPSSPLSYLSSPPESPPLSTKSSFLFSPISPTSPFLSAISVSFEPILKLYDELINLQGINETPSS